MGRRIEEWRMSGYERIWKVTERFEDAEIKRKHEHYFMKSIGSSSSPIKAKTEANNTAYR
jgi:hypothetical protein